jgi:hypothetical protein
MSATPRRKKTAGVSANGPSGSDKPRKPRAKKPKDLEERLDQAIRDVMGTGPENSTPRQWRSLRETWRVQMLYPGRHVAFIDHHESDGSSRLLLRREILCVSRSQHALNKRLDKILATMPEGTEFRVRGTYVEPRGALFFV